MLEGKFGNCQVDEVLQTIVQGKGTGRLSIEGTSVFGGHVEAIVFIEDSRIVHMEAGAGVAYHSLVDLLSLREGSFAFAGGERSTVQDQSVAVSDVVLQVTTALDEWNSLRQEIGSVDDVFGLKLDGATTDLILTGEQWQVMARLDGRTSIRGIANAAGKGTIDVVKAVHGFVRMGLATEIQVPVIPQNEEPNRPQRRNLFGPRARK